MEAPRPPLAEALRSPELLASLPRLVAFAARRLHGAGWISGCADVPGPSEAEDVVQEAFARCLGGEWTWPAGVSLEHLLFGVVRNLVSRRCRRAAGRKVTWLEDQGEVCAPPSRRDEALGARRLLAVVEHELEGDPDIGALLAVIADGATKPADIAAALGWTPERASVVRRRMHRRLAAAGLRNGDDDEGLEGHRPAADARTPRRVSR